MTAVPLFGPKFRLFDQNGDPLAGGKVETYEAGTTTPLATYTTYVADVANTNPVILDADGYADIWLTDSRYKIVVRDADDALIFTVDNVPGAIPILETVTSPSASSVAIATGSKTFSVEENKAFPVGGFVMITYDQDVTQFMHGQITSYTGDQLVVDVAKIGGSGTYNDWTVSLSGPSGPTGPAGPSGAGTGDMVGSANLAVGAGGVADAAAARGNLGLGTAALLDVSGANGIAKAWGSFKNLSGNSTYATFNVSSVSDDGVGVATVNLSTSFAASTYTVVTGGNREDGSSQTGHAVVRNLSTSSFQIRTYGNGTAANSLTDWSRIHFAAFGAQ